MAAARRCFFNAPAAVLDLILVHLGMSRPKTVYDKLVELLQRLLGPLTDEQLVPLLGKRIAKKDNSLDALMKNSDLLGELGKQDKAAVEDLRLARGPLIYCRSDLVRVSATCLVV